MKLKHFLLSMLFVFTLFSNVATANEHAGATEFKTQSELIAEEKATYEAKSVTGLVGSFFQTTGLNAIVNPVEGLKNAHGIEVSTFANSIQEIEEIRQLMRENDYILWGIIVGLDDIYVHKNFLN